MRERIDAFVAEHAGAILQMCRELVQAGSIHPPGDVCGPAAVLERFFTGCGLSCSTHRAVPHKPNLVVSVDSGRPGPHLVLNGHLDTISAGNELHWTVPVLELTECRDRLYGLGIGNMKAGVAALAFATALLAGDRKPWRGKLTFTAVADETVFGPDGAASLLEAMPELAGDALLCAEGPGFMNLGVAEKGLLWVRIEAEAPPGQGMLSQRGSSAIARLVKVLAAVDEWDETVATAPDELPGLHATAGNQGLRLSANVGTVAGGHFISQAADRAAAEVDFRVPPGLTLACIEQRLDEVAAATPGVSWTRIKGWEPNWTSAEQPICRSVAEACLHVTTRRPEPVVRLPASDAARWRRLGVPAVCFGPQPLLTSGVDDFVFHSDVLDCVRIYALAALDYLAPEPLAAPHPGARLTQEGGSR